MEELTKLFDLERVHKGGAKFDPEKTKWFNQQYLRMRPDAELGEQLLKGLEGLGITTTTEKATAAVALLKERATFPEDLLEGTYLFTSGSPLEDNEEGLAELKKRWKPETADTLNAFIARISEMSSVRPDTLEQVFNEVLNEHGKKIGQIMPLYRLFMAGRMQGPGMFDVSTLLGKDEVIVRLKAGLGRCMAWE